MKQFSKKTTHMSINLNRKSELPNNFVKKIDSLSVNKDEALSKKSRSIRATEMGRTNLRSATKRDLSRSEEDIYLND